MSQILLLFICGILIAIPVAARFFGEMVATLGKLAGWNPKGTFWISAGLYALAGFIAPLIYTFAAPDKFAGTPFFVYVGIATFLSPVFLVVSYFVKRANPEIFKPRVKPADLAREAARNPPFAFFEPQEKRVEAATEVVNVPPGVTIRVKRSRTIQHTISVRWDVSGEISGSTNLVNIVNLSIKTAIEKEKQATYQEAETIEYEVELNGNTSHSYKLVWTDIWKQGFVDIKAKVKQQRVAFEYRERSELDVRPV